MIGSLCLVVACAGNTPTGPSLVAYANGDGGAAIQGINEGPHESRSPLLSTRGVGRGRGPLAAGGHKRELEGLVGAIDIDARTLVVNGVTVSVPSGVTIRHGRRLFTLEDLRVGHRVHVRGTPDVDIVVASLVLLQNRHTRGITEVEVEGEVSAREGDCPTLSFVVDDTRVMTDASTRFDDGECGDIENGVRVEVKGIRQADGTVKATHVEIEDDDEDDEDHEDD